MHIHRARLKGQKCSDQSNEERSRREREKNLCPGPLCAFAPKQDHEHPEKRKKCQRCPECKAVIRQPLPAFAEEETRQGSGVPQTEKEKHEESKAEADEFWSAGQGQRCRDYDQEWSVHGKKKQQGCQGILEEVMARGMINRRLHGLCLTPFPKGPDDDEHGECGKDTGNKESGPK